MIARYNLDRVVVAFILLLLSCFCVFETSPLKLQMTRHSVFHRGVQFFFKKNLLLTNSVTSGICMAVGDVVQQEFEYQTKVLPQRYDWGRAARMFMVGVAMGPIHHVYYLQLDKILPRADIKTVTKKILCDQTIASPLTILCFFFAMGSLEKKTISQVTSEIRKKFLYAYMGDCLYWPPIQFINFYFLPTQYRVVYINVATMVFNIFLSFVKHYDQKH